MSSSGAPKLKIDASGINVTIVATSWHTQITDGLLNGAERALKEAGNTNYKVIRVPGHSNYRWLPNLQFKKVPKSSLPSG